MEPEVLTFSGTHLFRRQHAGAGGRRTAELVAEERCPRCEGPLYPPDREQRATVARRGDPYPIWRPAGSKATACRCIPVCDICGFAESVGQVAQDMLVEGVEFEEDADADPDRQSEIVLALEYVWKSHRCSPAKWPVDRDRMILGLAAVQASGWLRGYELDEQLPANTTSDPHPGGWADPDN